MEVFYTEYVERVRFILKQYDEGAVLVSEAAQAIIGHGAEIETRIDLAGQLVNMGFARNETDAIALINRKLMV